MFLVELVALRAQKVADLQILSRTIASNLSAAVAFKDAKSANEILAGLRAAPTVTEAKVFLSDGSDFANFLINSSHSTFKTVPDLETTAPSSLEKVIWARNSLQVFQPVLLDGEVIATIKMSASDSDINHRLSVFATVTGIIMLIASLLAYVFTAKLQSMILAPILDLTETATKVTATKNFTVRVENAGKDEVGHLVKCFNEMLVEIEIRDQQLGEAREKLEQRVAQRTAELSAEMSVRKQTQEALQREQEQLLTLIKHAPVAIAMLDTNLNYLAHSDRWMSDLELSGGSIIAKNHLTSVLNMPAHWKGAYEQVLNGQPFTQPEDELLLASGTKLYLRWTAQPWYRPNGDLGGVLKVIVVITELIKAREAAIRSAKLRTEFLTNVSHELRTPLNAIVGFARLLLDSGTSNAERDEYIQIINHSGQLLNSLINDVLDFSKIESKKISFEKISFEPREIVIYCIDLFRGSAKLKNISLNFAIEGEVPVKLQGDPTRLKQILVNLIGNAVKFTSQGTVAIKCSFNDISNTRCELIMTVSDTGIGIAPDKLCSIFEAFTQADGTITRNYGGTGLGLTIVRELATAMNGEVTVKSTLGEGSTFLVKLPFEKSVANEALATSTGKEAALSIGSVPVKGPTLKILVADDNKVNQKLIFAILNRRGHSVKIVENGREAVNILQSETFDIVLMDLQMPEMGGIEASMCIREQERSKQQNRNRLPIVALTAHAFAEDRERCKNAGMDEYLTKPIDTKKLFEVLARLATAHQHLE